MVTEFVVFWGYCPRVVWWLGNNISEDRAASTSGYFYA